MAERNVPGHTQFTRIPSRAYSTAATFASWITAAFVAQYGAACDHAVRPGDRRRQHDRARPLRAHDGHRGPDAVDGTEDVDPERALPVLGGQVVDATVRREHAGVADQHVEAAEALDRQRDHGFDLVEVAHVGEHRLDRAVGCREAGDGRLERRRADVAQHEIGGGLAGELVRHRRAERAARARDRDDPSRSAPVIRAGTRRRR